jgi:peptide/nickel transport system permease protein
MDTLPSLAAPAVPASRRSGVGRWLAGFGFSGLVGLVILVFWLATALVGPALLPRSLVDLQASVVYAPIDATHWLGTDYLGRDMLVRVVQGARYTVGLALVATLLASGTGTVLALLAASSGPVLDAVLSRLLDTLTSIPSKMFALVLVAGFGSSVGMLVFTAALIYVPGAFRIARSLAVNINALDYVTVARTRGEGKLYIMLREILPNIIGPMLADLGLRFVYVVLLLASLSFLGLGIQPPEADWGSLVRG